METEVASVVLGAITAVAAVVWLTGLQFLLLSSRKGQPGSGDQSGRFEVTEAHSTRILAGSAEVAGQASSLTARATSLLAKEALFPNVPVKILEKSEDHVRFERSGPTAAGRSAGGWVRQGELRFTPLGQGHTRVEWAVELTDMRWLLWLGGLFQAVGLIALVAGCWAVHALVVCSPDPAVRWQTLQMMQVAHLLWPPFLLGALYRRGRREVTARFEALVNNLPYVVD